MAYLIDNKPRIRQFRRPRRATPSGVIVVHTAEVYPDEKGTDTGAENVADFIRRRTNYGSYHDLADSDSIINLVPYDAEAYHDGTGTNPHSYGVSAATMAARWPSLDDDWVDATVRNMARAAARYARWIKAEYGVTIPARRITRTQSTNRMPGFISHGERDPGRRTDPGPTFPWSTFFAYYAAEMGGTSPTPTPTPEDDMTPEQAKQLAAIAGTVSKTRTVVREEVARALAGKANITEWTESLLPPPGARSRDGLIGYAAALAYDARQRVAALQAAIAAIPGVDGEKLAADVAAAVAAIDADSIVDELSERLGDGA